MKIIVVGGGFAGLSAAYYSALEGHDVTILEASYFLGGLWRQIKTEKFSYSIDNGQHILSGAYTQTLDLLDAAGARKLFWNTGRLDVPFVYNNKKFRLNTKLLPSPLGELLGIFLYRKLDLKSKIDIIKFLRNLPNRPPNKISTAEDYINSQGMTHKAMEYFWNPIIISACNTKPSVVSAVVVYNMLMKIFGGKKIQSEMLIPKAPIKFILLEIETLLLKHRVNVLRHKKVIKINSVKDKVKSIETADGEVYEADMFVFSGTLREYAGLNDLIEYYNKTQHFSCIVSGFFLYDKPIMKEHYVALLGTQLHWIFAEPNQGEIGYMYKLTASDANGLRSKDHSAIVHIFKEEIKRNFPEAKNANLMKAHVIKSSYATPIINPQFQKKRLKTTTHFKNLFLAGSYIDTGLPITIESAVVSGKMAADAIKKSL